MPWQMAKEWKIGVYLRAPIFQYLTFLWGPVAQLIERVVRNDEVVGLIPIWSTNFRHPAREARNARECYLRGEAAPMRFDPSLLT